MKAVCKRIGIILAWVLGGLLALVFLIWGGLNLFKFILYSDYYAVKQDVCLNPGLSDGFVCQGIGVSETYDRILVSGYMNNGEPSRIYVTDRHSNSYYVSLCEGGRPFDGHVGGLAVEGDTVYLASDGHLWTVDAKAVLAANNGDTVDITGSIPVNNHASFVFSTEEYLFVGEFHDGGKYVTEHPYDTPDGRQHAIISRYPIEDLSKPDRVYSVRDRVQGVCFTERGRVILSTSYGLSDTKYYVYDETAAVDSGLTLDGAPVYYLVDPIREVKGPAMGEDVDVSDGRVYTLFESASDKYIFGKFFFADRIVSLRFE